MKKLIFCLVFVVQFSFSQNEVDSLWHFYGKGNKEKAIYFGEIGLNKLLKINDTLSINYAHCLYLTSILQQDQSWAEKKIIKSLLLYRKILGNKNKDYSLILNQVSNYFFNKNKYDEAELYFKELISVREYNLETKSNEYFRDLFFLGFIYYQKSDYNNALPIFKKVAESRKEIFGENNDDYITTLNFIGLTYQKLNILNLAENTFLKTYETNLRFKGEGDKKNKQYLSNLTTIYNLKEEFNKAEIYHLKILQLDEKLFGTNSLEYSYSLNNIAYNYSQQGLISKIEPLYLKSLEIKKILLGDEHIDYLATLSNLASFYSDIGNFDKAELLNIECLNKRRKINKNNLDYAISLNSLATLYQNKGEYDKAEKLFIESLEVRKLISRKSDDTYLKALNNIALLYKMKGDYLKAETIFLEIIAIEKTKKDINYAITLNNLGNLYTNMSNFLKAKECLLESNQITKEILGENHLTYLNSLNSLASLYDDLGDDNVAEEYYKKVQNILDTKIEKNNQSLYLTVLNNLGLFYKKKGDYKSSETILLNCLEIEKNVFGKDHPEYLTSLSNLATLYHEQERYLKSEELLLEVKEKRIKILGKTHPDYLKTLNNLAILYNDIGYYKKSEQIYTEIIKNENVILDKSKANYATVFDNIGVYFLEKGNLKNAEYYLEKSRSIRENILGIYHLEYSNSLNNLAMLFGKLNNNKKKEEYLLKALEIKKKILGENHSDYAGNLSNLAVYYLERNQLEKAKPLIIKTIEIEKSNFGENSIRYASSISNLASLEHDQGNWGKAKDLISKSLEIEKNILGVNHKNYLETLSNLSIFYQKEKDYKNALLFCELVLEKRKKYLGQFHSDTNKSVINLLILYCTINNFNKIEQLSNELFAYFKEEIKSSTTFLSIDEINKFSKKNIEDLYFIFSILQSHPSQFPEINTASFDNQLLLKNLSLRNQQRIKTTIEKSSDATIKEKYQQFIDNKRYITKLDELPIAQLPAEYQQLITNTENLEKELTRLSATFADAKKSLSINWKQVQEKLKPNEIAIDLVDYTFYNKKWTDSIYYGAFIIKKDSKFPKYLTLFEEKQLKQLLSKNNIPDDKTKIDKQYTEKAISDLFLKPLENELQDISTVYFSASGLGHQIDFAALPLNETQTFGEKYKLHLLSSPSELVDYKTAALNPKNNVELLLYGGIDYNVTQAKERQIENEYAITSNKIFEDLGNRSGYGKLEGTLKEVEAISKNANNSGFNSMIFKEGNATEESIKALDGRTTPFVLHIATHGFFFENIKQEIPKDIISIDKKYQSFEDPMLRSGLLLAGANKFWTKTTQETTTDDGILTASEISNLDLSACQLVVLSACETGLGQINGSEGVFGLQRAFKMAGVKNIIMSLWKVPDAQTSELFDIFYKECFAGKTIHEAFQTAQTQMKVKYSPYYWAGFVLLE